MRDRLAQTLLQEKKRFIFTDISFLASWSLLIWFSSPSSSCFVTKVLFCMLAGSLPTDLSNEDSIRGLAILLSILGSWVQGSLLWKQSLAGNPDHSRRVVLFHSSLHCLPLAPLLSPPVCFGYEPSHMKMGDCRSPSEIQTLRDQTVRSLRVWTQTYGCVYSTVLFNCM